MTAEIANLRLEYSKQTLLEQDVAAHPVDQFGQWWKQAINSEIVEPNAMTLATASCDGLPAARVVLLKSFDKQGFVFFSNYKSYKGVQLEENPRACLVFYWKELERQVRITGLVVKLPQKESDEYFSSRPRGSRIGAVASPQSQVISSRHWLHEQYNTLATNSDNEALQRPGHWGGYVVQPIVIEFWQGGPSRLHDRIQYTLDERGAWKIERLAP
ncbi:MAG TPA: pyridoxamine 5'-phosphate oxidase [Flavisolibacter sp.]|jgi:pyridoxamine 5'-phosphate oxidase|nr:pyridoxamine 5'-phosphate oxidase [Flavisolibacter sp.]